MHIITSAISNFNNVFLLKKNHNFSGIHALRFDFFSEDIQAGQSCDTHVVISHYLFTFCARLKVCFTIIFMVVGGVQKLHLVQTTKTRNFFLMTLYF